MKEKFAYTIDMIKKNIKEYFADLSGTVSELANDVKNHKKPSLTKRQIISSASTVAAVAVIAAVIAVPGFTSAAKAGAGMADTSALKEEALLAEDAQKTEEGQYYIISVNGADVALLSGKEEAEATLEAIKANYITSGAEVISAEFKEEVAIRSADIRLNEEGKPDVAIPSFENAQDAKAYILTGTSEPKTYVVQGGDTLWDIAMNNGISVYELQDMNPQLTPDTLSIGQELYLYELHPFVTVAVTERVTATEAIPYDTTYENSDSLYKGQYSVKSAGVKGSKEVTTEYVKENGIVQSSTVVAENVISQPVAQVSYVGTATVQIQTGSGQLQSPLSSVKVNSSFGASRGGGSRSHAGVDLGGTKGQPIMAADAGTVIFSGWGEGSLGYTVKIDHGNGLTTVYAHCSELYATYGQNVSKGEVIAAVGKTGNATGYLLHFEVRVNGRAQNPMNYL